jgi:hypothetical protein
MMYYSIRVICFNFRFYQTFCFEKKVILLFLIIPVEIYFDFIVDSKKQLPTYFHAELKLYKSNTNTVAIDISKLLF